MRHKILKLPIIDISFALMQDKAISLKSKHPRKAALMKAMVLPCATQLRCVRSRWLMTKKYVNGYIERRY
jgi:hypothetical protein